MDRKTKIMNAAVEIIHTKKSATYITRPTARKWALFI